MPSRPSSHHQPSHSPSHIHSSPHPEHKNPPCPLTAPPTTITLPPRLTRLYIPLLRLPPSHPHHKTTLLSLPRPLLKPAYRKPSLLTRLARSLSSHRSPSNPINTKPAKCDLCPLHHPLAEDPLLHLMSLMTYELHTHLQSLRSLHPSSRSATTNEVLESLHHWHENQYLEPGLRVKGCLACCLGYFLGDRDSVWALGVVARSARKKTRDGRAVDGALVGEGWLDGLGSWVRGEVGEVMGDRRRARGMGVSTTRWEGGRVREEDDDESDESDESESDEEGYTEPRSSNWGHERVRRQSMRKTQNTGRFKGDSAFTNLDDLAYARGQHMRRQQPKTPTTHPSTPTHRTPTSQNNVDGSGKKRDSGATTLQGSPLSPPQRQHQCQHHHGRQPSWVRSDTSASPPAPLNINRQRPHPSHRTPQQPNPERRDSISINPSHPPPRSVPTAKTPNPQAWRDQLPSMSTYNHEFSAEDAAFEDMPLVVPSILPVNDNDGEGGEEGEEFDFDEVEDGEGEGDKGEGKGKNSESGKGKGDGVEGGKGKGKGEVSEATQERYVQEHVSFLRYWEQPQRMVKPGSSFYSRPVDG